MEEFLGIRNKLILRRKWNNPSNKLLHKDGMEFKQSFKEGPIAFELPSKNIRI